MKQVRNIHWAVALALLLLAGCGTGSEKSIPTPLPPLEVVQPAEYKVELGTVQRTLTFSGRVAPILSQPVFFQDDGVVTDVLVQQGAAVSEGDLIAHLDVANLQHQLVTAELALEAAELQTNQADLVAAEIALSRAETEDDRRLAEAQLADARNQVKADELAVQLLREEVKRIQAEITRRQVVAPFDGVLLTVNVRPGDKVAAFAPIVTIVDPSQLEVMAEVSPAVVIVLGVGQAVKVTLPTSGLNFGSVIRQLPAAVGASGENQVRISLPETTNATSGELASVFVVLEERCDVLTLPPAAIRTFQGRTFVVVAEPDGMRRRFDVRLGLQSETLVEIVEGVVEGQVVLGE
jgi:macrolide-specific efflux system membrane fusion protein